MAVIAFGYAAGTASAHRHGCHRWHTCPSDHATYRWRGLLCVAPTRASAIRSKTSSGQFTVTGTSATVARPKGIAVRFVGKGFVVWGCSKGVSVSSWSRHYSRSGFYLLPYVRGKDSCNVTASVSNQGRATVAIYKARW